MAIVADLTNDASRVLAQSQAFLAADPVRHNLILTLLHANVANPREGRFAVAMDRSAPGDVVGVVFQSPLSFAAAITPMDEAAVEACVGVLANASPPLPGVLGEVASTAWFAGRWTERMACAAIPVLGQRLYEASLLQAADRVLGTLRRATEADRETLVRWFEAFGVDTGEHVATPERAVDASVAAQETWIWDDGTARCMASLSAPVAGVERVRGVYTPPDYRGSGFASACVAELTSRVLGRGHRSVLYTDLGNATSNAIYRHIGYRAVAEVIRYRFSYPEWATVASDRRR